VHGGDVVREIAQPEHEVELGIAQVSTATLI
jgi:hypothetical protein